MRLARVLISCLALCAATPIARAATEADATSSLAAASAEEAKAVAAKSAWTPTETALAAAKKALAAGDFDLAKRLADEALALARRSIEQSHEQQSVWRDAEIR